VRTLLTAAVAVFTACNAPTTVTPPATTVASTVTPSAAASTAMTTSSPTATVATIGTLAPGAARYSSSELGYSLDLPPGWRRASCSPGVRAVNPIDAAELFVGQPEAEESVGPGVRMVEVRILQSQGLTPAQHLERDASQPDIRVEPTTVNGRDGARALIGGTGVTYAFAVGARGWIYHAEFPYFGTADAELGQIIATIRVHDAVVGGPQPTPAPRSVETLADSAAVAFARKDLTGIADTLASCVAVSAVPGDGTLLSRGAYLKEVAAEFAAGSTVQVRPRPIEDDPALGRVLRSTWSRSGQPDRRVDLVLRATGDRWSIANVLIRREP
jgi:hypothetical protein